MKFDDASWHYEGDYPADLPESAAATHIGMFLAWALLHGMAGEELIDDSARGAGRFATPGIDGRPVPDHRAGRKTNRRRSECRGRRLRPGVLRGRRSRQPLHRRLLRRLLGERSLALQRAGHLGTLRTAGSGHRCALRPLGP
ncbi:hypothetical protein WJ970_29215 [Achromobacter xylosoxidans]